MPQELLRQSLELGQSSAAAPAAALVAAPAGIAVTTLAGSLLYANDAFRRLFGIDDVSGTREQDIRRLTHDLLSEEFLLAAARESGQRQITVTCTEGSQSRELLCTAERVMHGATPIYLALVVQDISNLVDHHREQLQGTMELLDAQSVIHSCSWVLPIDPAGSIHTQAMSWAPGSSALFGTSGAPKSFQDYLKCIEPAYRDSVASAITAAIAQHGEYSVEYELRARDGSKRRMRSVGRFVSAENGARSRIMAIDLDLTVHERPDECSAMYGPLLEHVSVPVMVLDRRCRYRYFNRAFSLLAAREMGTEPQLGDPALGSIANPMRRRLLADALARVMRGEEPVYEHEFIDTDDRVSQWIDFHFKPLRDADGTIDGAMVLGRDVSPLKRANARHQYLNAELKRRVERRTAEMHAAHRDFANRVAQTCDDVRQEFCHVQDLLRTALTNPAPNESLQQALAAIATMESRIEQLARLSAIGTRKPQRRSIDMNRLIQELRNDLAYLMEGRIVEFDIDHLPSVVADRVLIRQIFHTLLSNAITYTKNRPAARIRMWAAKEAGTIVWSVADNGIGFDMKEADAMFSSFARHGPRPRGTGLSIAWHAVHQLNGRIWCESRPGQGATFRLTIGDA